MGKRRRPPRAAVHQAFVREAHAAQLLTEVTGEIDREVRGLGTLVGIGALFASLFGGEVSLAVTRGDGWDDDGGPSFEP